MPQIVVTASSQVVRRQFDRRRRRRRLRRRGGQCGEPDGPQDLRRRSPTSTRRNDQRQAILGTDPSCRRHGEMRTEGAADKVIGFAVGIGGGGVLGHRQRLQRGHRSLRRSLSHDGALQLAVTADSTSGFFGLAGAGAAGTVIGLAGGYTVSTSNETATLAYVGNSGNVTVINPRGRLAVNAVSANTFDSSAVGGALAGGEGYAGMVNIVAVNNIDARRPVPRQRHHDCRPRPRAIVDSSNNPVNNPAGVQVTANETMTVKPTTGSGAVGFQARARALRPTSPCSASSVVAESVDSTINVPGAVVITAEQHQECERADR